ncbi:MAG: hypothetical protein Q9212_003807 [Teloschistes hypoglaucus]
MAALLAIVVLATVMNKLKTILPKALPKLASPANQTSAFLNSIQTSAKALTGYSFKKRTSYLALFEPQTSSPAICFQVEYPTMGSSTDTESCDPMKSEHKLSLEVRYHREPLDFGTSTRYIATSFELGEQVGDDTRPFYLRRNIRNGCRSFKYLVGKRLAEAVKMSAELPDNVSNHENDDEAEAEKVQDDSEKALAMSVRMWEREMWLLNLKAHQWWECSQEMRCSMEEELLHITFSSYSRRKCGF